MVFCLGGGCFGAAVISTSENGAVTVKTSIGDSHLGGLSFENKMAEYAAKKSPTISEEERRILKERLSKSNQIRTGTQKNPGFQWTRDTFESINKELFISTLDYVDTVLEAAGLDPSDIDDVILVGGSCRIPFMIQILGEFFGQDRLHQLDEEAVVRGAAIYASAIQNGTSSNMLIDVSTNSIGMSFPERLVTDTIWKKNERLCTHHRLKYIPHIDEEESVLTVLEGDKSGPHANKKIGTIKLRHTPLARDRGYVIKSSTDFVSGRNKSFLIMRSISFITF